MYNQMRLTYALGYNSTNKYILNLNDETNLRVEEYTPNIGNEGDLFVSETIEIMIKAPDRNIVYKRRQEIDFIIGLAKQSWEESSQFPVYMEIWLPDMNQWRRTRVVDGRFEFANNTLSLENLGNNWLIGRLVITRLNYFEGPYKDLNIYGNSQIAADQVRLTNRGDGNTASSYNGVKVLGTDLEGDLPGFARISMIASATPYAHILEIFRGNPFEGDDSIFLGGGLGCLLAEVESQMTSSIVDSNSSATHYGQTAVGATYTNVWAGGPTSISLSMVGFPPGWYALYARHPSGAIPYTNWRIKGRLGSGSVENTLATFESDVSGFMRLCTFYRPNNKLAYLSSDQVFLELQAKIGPSGGNYQLDCLYVAPLACAYALSLLPTQTTVNFLEVVDFAENENWKPTAFNTRNTPAYPTAFGIRTGSPITLMPRMNNYLFFFNLQKDENDPSATLDLNVNATFDIAVGYRPRYRTI